MEVTSNRNRVKLSDKDRRGSELLPIYDEDTDMEEKISTNLELYKGVKDPVGRTK